MAIVFNNWNITIVGTIARQYDNLSRRIDVEGDLPDGYEWKLLLKHESGDADTILLEPTETGVGVVLTADNLAKAGHYRLQLRGVLKADWATVRHTNVAITYIPESLTGVGKWPELPTEFAQIEQRCTASMIAAESAAATAKAQADAAAQSAAGAAQSAQQAAESAAVYDNVVTDVNQLKQDFAAITPDDTAVNGKPWTSKKIVDSLCQPFEESGNPVQCYPVENYPLGVKVSWEPVQEGEGDPSPDNIRPITGRDAVRLTRCGKNLIDTSRIELGTYDQSTGEPVSGLYNQSRITCDIGCAAENQMVYSNFNKENGRAFFWNDNGYVGTLLLINGSAFTPITGSKYMRLVSASQGFIDAQLELGSTATPYEPYTGSTTDISLPETVYGGTLDVESGVVTVTHGNIAAYAGESIPGRWISDRDIFSDGAVPTTGAQVVYELEQPYTIQLTPQRITALSGVNTIYTNADGVIVTGREDPQHTITELKNAIISLGGNI